MSASDLGPKSNLPLRVKISGGDFQGTCRNWETSVNKVETYCSVICGSTCAALHLTLIVIFFVFCLPLLPLSFSLCLFCSLSLFITAFLSLFVVNLSDLCAHIIDWERKITMVCVSHCVCTSCAVYSLLLCECGHSYVHVGASRCEFQTWRWTLCCCALCW